MKGADTHDEVKGSTPSRGIYFKGVSKYPKTNEHKNSAYTVI
jgi:hypothetical protein